MSADESWEEVRTARTHSSVVVRSQAWLSELWPVARSLGLTTRSTQGFAVPDILVDEMMNPWKVAEFYRGCIILLGPRSLDATIQRHMEWGSPTLSAPPPARLDYLRAAVLHEVQHALDYVSGRNIFVHDKRFYARLGRLEERFSPLGL